MKNNVTNNRLKYYNNILDNSISVLASGILYKETADNYFPFSVDRCFYYLTGINQENVYFVAVKLNNEVKEYLFIEKNVPALVKWVGYKLEKEEALSISGIENILYIDEFDEFLEKLKGISNLYLNLKKYKDFYCYNDDFAKRIKNILPSLNVLDCYSIIVDLRFIKEDYEISKIKESIEITNKGLKLIMSNLRSGLYEYELANIFNFALMNANNRKTSFETIVASGKNAVILHYVDNNCLTKDGDLILFDLGTHTDFYISDISRTYPVNGKFTPRQKEVYQEVLNVNKKCIEYLKPGLSIVDFNNYAKSLLIEACKRLKLIEKDEDVSKYYYHSIGHSIGLDTHDPANYKNGIEHGCCMTVEPGLYIEEENIGIRIEDNVLVLKEGNINLSESIIKEVDDIEAFFEKENKKL